MPLTKVKISREELWYYYDDWGGYGKPDLDVEIPTELWEEYKKSMSAFFSILDELKTFLKDD